MAGEMASGIGRRIRQARLDVGMQRQRDLVDRIEAIAREEGEPVAIDNQRVSDWERGVNTPSERYMQLLVKALGRDLAWFYGRETSETPDLVGTMNGERTQLDKVLENQTEMLSRLDAIEERLTAALVGLAGAAVAQALSKEEPHEGAEGQAMQDHRR